MAIVYPWQAGGSANPMLDAALAYAALGIAVFPVHGLRSGSCSCGSTDCKSPAKHPATAHGLHDATTDANQIRQWWGAKPYLNIGSPTADRITLDVDPRNGGDESLDQLETRYGKLPATWHVLTGGGGSHFSYRVPAGTRIKTAHPISPAFPGIDLQAAGAYVLLPPSRHISGNQYLAEASSDLLEGQVIADAPGWLLRLCELHTEGERSAAPVELHEAFPTELADARKALDRIDPDCSYDRWVRIGQALHSTCWLEAFALWNDWSAQGEKYPGELALRRKWKSFDANRSSQVTINTLYWEAQQEAPPAAAATPQPGFLVFASELMAERQTAAWTIKGIVPENTLGQIFGASGSGKTFVHLDMGLHVATGRDWHGHKVKQGAVLLVAGEGFHGLVKRLHAWAGHYQQDMTGTPFLITRSTVVVSDRKALGALRDEIARVQDRLSEPLAWIVLDTLNRTFGAGDENATQDMSAFVDGMAWLRDNLSTGVCPIHHTGHLETGRSRGNSSLYGALDYEVKVDRDRDSRILKLSCTKMKDSEEFPCKYFESVPVGTPVTDEDGEIQTSIVLRPAEPPAPDGEPSKHLRTARDIALQLATEQAARLAASGYPVPSPLVVSLAEVKTRFVATAANSDAGRKAWYRLKRELVALFGGSDPLKITLNERDKGGT